MASERREVWFSGRVQGVGFRYTTQQIATNFAVTGFVKNLPDGRVQLVVEGAKQEIADLISAIQSRMADHVRDVEQTASTFQSEFNLFEIRR